MAQSSEIAEGRAKLRIPNGVFFNPEMKFCRDYSVLAIRAALKGKKRLRLVDATAATGVRAIRYRKECGGIAGETFLVDLNASAARSASANVRLNRLKNAKVVKASFAKFCQSSHAEEKFGIVELDPFGSPVPLLYDAARVLRNGALLSATATDMAVLCGAHPKACLKNYQAKPLKSGYCHEVAVRILLGKIARTVSEFNFGIKPVASLSHLHYVKVFALLESGAENAVASIKETGFVAHCNKCLHRVWRKGVANSLPAKCPACGAQFEFAGPLWLGEIHDKKALLLMLKEAKDPKLQKLIRLQAGECGMPPFFFDLHQVTEKLGIRALAFDSVVRELKRMGFKALPVHFRPNCVKTDADSPAMNRAALSAKAIK